MPIAKALIDNKILQDLQLDAIGIVEEAMRFLMSVLESGGAPSLTSLGLSENVLWDGAAKMLVEVVAGRAGHCRLELLHIRNTRLTPECALALACAVGSPRC